MSLRRNRTFVVTWLIPLLIGLAALALPASGEAAGTGSISGTVSGQGAGGLAGIEVCAWSRSEDRATEEEDWGCTESGAGGSYTISGLPTDQYTVEFWPKEQNFVWQYYAGVQSWELATPVVVTEGASTSGINTTLAKGAQVKGRVTAAATGLPVSGVQVCAAQSPEGVPRCAFTDSSGNYTVNGLGAGTYRLYFFPEATGTGLLGQEWNGHELIETGEPFSIAAGSVNEHFDAALRPGGSITGTVRLAATGAPLPGVSVCLVEAAFPISLGCTTTSASGTYHFIGVWSGRFKAVFSAEPGEIQEEAEEEIAIVDSWPTQWWNGQSTFVAATPVQVTAPGAVSGIDAAFGPPPAITTPPAVAPVAPITTAPVQVKKKRPATRCRKGLVKRKVRGKAKCVRLHKAAKHKHRHKKPA